MLLYAIAQNRPPMSFCFYPTLYLGNHLYFLKPVSSWKQQKNTLISEIANVHSTKRVVVVTPQHLLVTSQWCPSSRAPNITNISCWKIAPKLHWYLVKLFKIEASDIFQIPKVRCLFYQSVPHCLWFYHCVSASPIIPKIVRFFHSFVDSCIETICHHEDFTGRVLLWENFISPRNNLFHTQKRFFLAR